MNVFVRRASNAVNRHCLNKPNDSFDLRRPSGYRKYKRKYFVGLEKRSDRAFSASWLMLACLNCFRACLSIETLVSVKNWKVIRVNDWYDCYGLRSN